MSSYFEHWRLAVKGNLRPERGSGAGFLLLLPYRGATSKGAFGRGHAPGPAAAEALAGGDGPAEGLGSENQRAPVAGLALRLERVGTSASAPRRRSRLPAGQRRPASPAFSEGTERLNVDLSKGGGAPARTGPTSPSLPACGELG
jgi:hypothetical protein